MQLDGIQVGMRPFAYFLVAALALSAATAPATHKLDWRTLRGLNYKTGDQSTELKKVNGQVAKVPGFMIPLEDDAEMVSEFLLVPYVGACIHTPPPPPNQIVHVKMASSRKTKLSFWEPVWVEGKFEVVTVKSPYGDVSFKMTANMVEPYKE